jgi:hypothetical protein
MEAPRVGNPEIQQRRDGAVRRFDEPVAPRRAFDGAS